MNTNPFKLVRDAKSGFDMIGSGSLGGKARGLVHLQGLLSKHRPLIESYAGIQITIPTTLIVASDAFDAFMQDNQLDPVQYARLSDDAIAQEFVDAKMPSGLRQSLTIYLDQMHHPLAVRSSGLMEDATFHAYAGLYSTYMLSNDQADPDQRLAQLLIAVKLVYASTFFKGPRAYAKRVGHDISKDRMAVIVQQVAGKLRGQCCYPDISGVAQSRNHYPLAGFKAGDGLATIALGMGKQVVSGGRALRFSPKYPRRLLQCNTVDDVLTYAQRRFYALPMGTLTPLDRDERNNLIRRDVSSAIDELPLAALAGTYVLDEHRIRDSVQIVGPKVLTFAGVLKYNFFPLAKLLRDLLDLGQAAHEVPIEMEFAVNLAHGEQTEPQFYLLQMRPMTARVQGARVVIHDDERQRALCYTRHAMGNGTETLQDIVFVKPDPFDPSRTRAVAAQIAQINAQLEDRQQNYLLVGPGRWGSADPWLGIPVRWADISQVGAIIETASDKLNAEPSQGAHFFHNLAALGINYLGVTQQSPDRIDWAWLLAQPRENETEYIAHVHLDSPLLLKVDGRTSQGVILIEGIK